ncbi:unnamed protein product [Microthlaspi erraticum]|uniref:RNase H type-1 domain-containing protein n=1 Tax=Microthlaspi erraticum TaxID=1685480 RepID=A0A6D2KZY7_9BRAS|nr:unnamed protein product [Microthlaspi erraticum]
MKGLHPIQPLTSSWKLWIIELAFVWRWFHVIRTSGSEDTTILVGLDPPARPASFQLDRAAFPGVKGSGPVSPWILWSLWKSRNKRSFNATERQFTPEETITQAVSSAREWQAAQLGIENHHTGSRQGSQRRSRLHAVRCHSDAAWRKETETAGLGWCFSNDRGDPLGRGSTTRSTIRSPLMAEALVLLSAMQHALEIGHTHIIVASDSQKLIGAINREDPSKELHGILHDILDFSKSFTAISFIFVSREDNVLADRLAKNALADLGQGPV